MGLLMSCIQVKSLSNLRGLDRLLTPTVYQETLLARFLFPAMRPGGLFGSYSYRIRSGAYLATYRDEGYDTKTIDSKATFSGWSGGQSQGAVAPPWHAYGKPLQHREWPPYRPPGGSAPGVSARCCDPWKGRQPFPAGRALIRNAWVALNAALLSIVLVRRKIGAP